MSQDVKIFDLDIWGPQKIQIEAFSILGSCPWMLKASILDDPRFGGLDSQTSKPGSHPKSKLLASRGMAPGC